MPYARSDSAGAAQTDTSLVAAPGADKQIVVHSVFVNTDIADQVLIESGTTNQRWEVDLPATAQSYAQDDRGLFRCAVNEALTYSTGTTSNVFVSVRYEIARATGE